MAISEEKSPVDLTTLAHFSSQKYFVWVALDFVLVTKWQKTCQKKEHTGGDALTIQIPYFIANHISYSWGQHKNYSTNIHRSLHKRPWIFKLYEVSTIKDLIALCTKQVPSSGYSLPQLAYNTYSFMQSVVRNSCTNLYSNPGSLLNDNGKEDTGFVATHEDNELGLCMLIHKLECSSSTAPSKDSCYHTCIQTAEVTWKLDWLDMFCKWLN
jgi:hypothetical protein